MTYRAGTYVVDVREHRLVQVVGQVGDRVQVRRPGGGLEWEVPCSVLRLASREEREAAGLRPYQTGCTQCAELDAARRAAVAGGDRARSGDATAAAHTHWIVAHSMPGEK